jgi:uncharacterized protein (TIGR03435 family)
VTEGSLIATRTSMDRFALLLSGRLGRPVVNRTEIMGDYDFKLEAAELGIFPVSDAPSPSPGVGPSIFSAVQEQLGLTLKSDKQSIESVAIEHAAAPSEN